ncbi:TniQ family protein [Calothrix sp. NIES-2098]|uniref:TniQ family protein n=1 Tax=Calothrix sp. NIES-2098 TaxID=1954171 RepID=UPI000B5F05C3|nr:TetR family transcriptional regulator [Calothrix sp. NIES-2098]
MLAEDLSTYEFWNLKKPLIPQCSRLYQLQPVGLGTSYIESLTGYISRIAESHGVLPGVLMTREIAPLINKLYFQNGASRGFREIFNRAQALNGVGEMAGDLVQALQKLTCSDKLHFLTMLFWAEILTPRNLFRAKRAWCPICYQDSYENEQVVYEQLLWTINCIKICSQHQKPLLEICPHCNHELPLLSWRSRPGYCSNCENWLGTDKCHNIFSNGKAPSNLELKWQSWTANVVGELISVGQCFESAPPKENIKKSLNIIIDIVAEKNAAAFARLIGVPKNSLWMWQSTETLPELNILLKICYELDISLVEFLSPKILIAKSLTKISQKYPQLCRTPRVSPKSFNQNLVRDALLAILGSDEEPPLTMQEVAKRLGYDRRTISRHFPDLCCAISAKRLDYNKACRLRSIEKFCNEVKQIVLDLKSQGVYPTEARVCELMANPGCFRYKQVRAAFHNAQGEFCV